MKQLNTLAGRQVWDLHRQLSKLGKEERYAPTLQIMARIVRQQRGDKNKVYSLHSAIEAIIGHLESDHSMGRNYLKGSTGDKNNALLAEVGFNLMLLLRELAGNFLGFILWALCSLIPSRLLRFAQNYAPPVRSS